MSRTKWLAWEAILKLLRNFLHENSFNEIKSWNISLYFANIFLTRLPEQVIEIMKDIDEQIIKRVCLSDW